MVSIRFLASLAVFLLVYELMGSVLEGGGALSQTILPAPNLNSKPGVSQVDVILDMVVEPKEFEVSYYHRHNSAVPDTKKVKEKLVNEKTPWGTPLFIAPDNYNAIYIGKPDVLELAEGRDINLVTYRDCHADLFNKLRSVKVGMPLAFIIHNFVYKNVVTNQCVPLGSVFVYFNDGHVSLSPNVGEAKIARIEGNSINNQYVVYSNSGLGNEGKPIFAFNRNDENQWELNLPEKHEVLENCAFTTQFLHNYYNFSKTITLGSKSNLGAEDLTFCVAKKDTIDDDLYFLLPGQNHLGFCKDAVAIEIPKNFIINLSKDRTDKKFIGFDYAFKNVQGEAWEQVSGDSVVIDGVSFKIRDGNVAAMPQQNGAFKNSAFKVEESEDSNGWLKITFDGVTRLLYNQENKFFVWSCKDVNVTQETETTTIRQGGKNEDCKNISLLCDDTMAHKCHKLLNQSTKCNIVHAEPVSVDVIVSAYIDEDSLELSPFYFKYDGINFFGLGSRDRILSSVPDVELKDSVVLYKDKAVAVFDQQNKLYLLRSVIRPNCKDENKNHGVLKYDFYGGHVYWLNKTKSYCMKKSSVQLPQEAGPGAIIKMFLSKKTVLCLDNFGGNVASFAKKMTVTEEADLPGLAFASADWTLKPGSAYETNGIIFYVDVNKKLVAQGGSVETEGAYHSELSSTKTKDGAIIIIDGNNKVMLAFNNSVIFGTCSKVSKSELIKDTARYLDCGDGTLQDSCVISQNSKFAALSEAAGGGKWDILRSPEGEFKLILYDKNGSLAPWDGHLNEKKPLFKFRDRLVAHWGKIEELLYVKEVLSSGECKTTKVEFLERFSYEDILDVATYKGKGPGNGVEKVNYCAVPKKDFPGAKKEYKKLEPYTHSLYDSSSGLVAKNRYEIQKNHVKTLLNTGLKFVLKSLTQKNHTIARWSKSIKKLLVEKAGVGVWREASESSLEIDGTKNTLAQYYRNDDSVLIHTNHMNMSEHVYPICINDKKAYNISVEKFLETYSSCEHVLKMQALEPPESRICMEIDDIEKKNDNSSSAENAETFTSFVAELLTEKNMGTGTKIRFTKIKRALKAKENAGGPQLPVAVAPDASAAPVVVQTDASLGPNNSGLLQGGATAETVLPTAKTTYVEKHVVCLVSEVPFIKLDPTKGILEMLSEHAGKKVIWSPSLDQELFMECGHKLAKYYDLEKKIVLYTALLPKEDGFAVCPDKVYRDNLNELVHSKANCRLLLPTAKKNNDDAVCVKKDRSGEAKTLVSNDSGKEEKVEVVTDNQSKSTGLHNTYVCFPEGGVQAEDNADGGGEDKAASDTAAIVGYVFAGIACVLVVIVVIWFVKRHRRSSYRPHRSASAA